MSNSVIVGNSFKNFFSAISLFTILFVPLLAAATEWRSYQDDVLPEASRSVYKASLSPDIKISKPDTKLPPNISFFSGIWAGSICDTFAEVKIAVRELATEGASMVFSLGNYTGSFNNQEYNASFLDGELVGKTKSGFEIILAQRPKDKYLNIKWMRGDNKDQTASTTPDICYGVLERIKRAES